MAAVDQVISSPGQSATLLAGNVAYFASFSGTSYTAQLQVNIGGDWLPAAAQITEAGNMTVVAFAGRGSDGGGDPLLWRWNVTAITGSLTVYLG